MLSNTLGVSKNNVINGESHSPAIWSPAALHLASSQERMSERISQERMTQERMSQERLSDRISQERINSESTDRDRHQDRQGDRPPNVIAEPLYPAENQRKRSSVENLAESDSKVYYSIFDISYYFIKINAR